MKISLKWLSDYLELDCPVLELVDKLTMAGIEVESLHNPGLGISSVVTGRIEEVHPHPNADKLKLCDVNDGKEIHTVVCGAPNVKRGLISAFAKTGATLPAGEVKRTKIRGVKSQGMLVSKKELGISDDHSGIYELPPDLPLGADLTEAIELNDHVLDISITPNRPDWLSVLGVARETGAAINKKYVRPENPLQKAGGRIDSMAKIEIEDPDLCPRYTGILVKDVKIAPSPMWMARRLEAVGVRSINNIVDISNFVQLEVGQPLHAFDYDFLEDHKIVVRRARPDEKIVTLDEVERELSKDALLICDGKKPVALAGIMGGQNSLVTDKTTDVFIESAYFHPPNIRQTSKKLGLSSESSYRFERGVDIDGVVFGLHRAANLMAELAGGKIVSGYIDAYPGKKEPRSITLRAARVNKILGTDIKAKEMAKLLQSIELPATISHDEIIVQVPTFRVDLEREVDLIEEVARLYGYDRIVPTTTKSLGVTPVISNSRKMELAVRDILVSLGMSEAINYAFSSPEKMDLFKDQPGNYVALLNPLNEDYGVLRDTLLYGLCANLEYNLKRQAKRVLLFELRRVYFPDKQKGKLPYEPLYVSGIIAGRREPEGWTQSNEYFDFFDVKGICEELFEKLGISEDITWEKGDVSYLDSDFNGKIMFKNTHLGNVGLLKHEIRGKFDIESPSYLFEINLDLVKDHVLDFSEFKAMSRFPMTTRDIAIIVDKSVGGNQIKQTILRVAPDIIKQVICFDQYMGDKVAKNEKSLAFSIRLQKHDSEVSDDEAGRIVGKVKGVLLSRFEAKLRE